MTRTDRQPAGVDHQLLEEIRPGDVVVLGFPLDENSSFMRGPALAPAEIQRVLHCGASTLWAENGICLENHPHFRELGVVELGSGAAALTEIEQHAGRVLERGGVLLSLGGDHSITYPLLRAFSKKNRPLNILHLDAHPDLYQEFEGSRTSHGCPFARIMEEKLAQRLVQVGIRAFNQHQREQAQRFGVESIEMKDWNPELTFDFAGPVYLSLDMDVLDPAFAPGVSHHEPGGLTTRQVIDLIHRLPNPIVGADLVEYNPKRDWQGMTAAAAAKLLKEIAAQMLTTNHPSLPHQENRP